VEGATRKQIYIPNCYSILPSGLPKRFKDLQSIKLKGKPRASEFDILEKDWGGHTGPWVQEIVRSYPKLQSLHLRRMEVCDEDLELLARGCTSLQVLKLDKCKGFTTMGLQVIAQSCRFLRELSLEESEITMDEGGQWLWELGQNNPMLEKLSIAADGLEEDNVVDPLLSVVQRCKFLTALKVREIEIEKFREVLKSCSMPMEELGVGCYSMLDDHRILATSLLPWVSKLKILDLKFALLSAEGQCELLSYCHSLEELELRSVVGDRGMDVVGKTCTQLKRIRVEQDSSEIPGLVSHIGMTALVEGCRELEFLVMYLSNITNRALAAVGHRLTKLTDFRIVLLHVLDEVEDLPLDQGVRSLLQGCQNLTRFSVYLRHGGLSDRGLAYIGEFGGNLKWILLGMSGESGEGLKHLASGCQKLERLELRGCPFGEQELAEALLSMRSLKALWVQGQGATEGVARLLARYKPFFHVEVMMHSIQILGYHSLASPRTDCPNSVQVLSAQYCHPAGAELHAGLEASGTVETC